MILFTKEERRLIARVLNNGAVHQALLACEQGFWENEAGVLSDEQMVDLVAERGLSLTTILS